MFAHLVGNRSDRGLVILVPSGPVRGEFEVSSTHSRDNLATASHRIVGWLPRSDCCSRSTRKIWRPATRVPECAHRASWPPPINTFHTANPRQIMATCRSRFVHRFLATLRAAEENRLRVSTSPLLFLLFRRLIVRYKSIVSGHPQAYPVHSTATSHTESCIGKSVSTS